MIKTWTKVGWASVISPSSTTPEQVPPGVLLVVSYSNDQERQLVESTLFQVARESSKWRYGVSGDNLRCVHRSNPTIEELKEVRARFEEILMEVADVVAVKEYKITIEGKD